MEELEQACKVIDELICLLSMTNRDMGERLFELNRVDEGLRLIANRMDTNDDYPVTMWIGQEILKRGYINNPAATDE